MTIRMCVTVLLLLGFMGGCGVDSELVASGKIHSCKITALQAQLSENPENQAALAAEMLETKELLDAVIQTADPGDRSALEKAIGEAVAEGCD